MWILDSQKWKTVQGLWTIPAVTYWIDKITWSEVWETVTQFTWLVDWVLNTIPEPISSFVAPATWILWAWLLSNQVMNDLWVENKWIKYWVNGVAMLGWYAAWTAAAPYLAGWAIAYWAWKHGWKLGKWLTSKIAKMSANMWMWILSTIPKWIVDTAVAWFDGLIKNKLVVPSFKPSYSKK